MSEIKVEYINHCGDDLSVVDAARCSFDKQSDWEYYTESGCSTGEIKGLKQSDEKLIKYLANHKHYSPFNHSFISVRVKAPVFVARQLVKHKFMPWNEVSRRYVKDEPEFYRPEAWRKSAENVKQGSSNETVDIYYEDLPKFSNPIEGSIKDDYKCVVEHAEYWYKELLKHDVCPEQARMLLPQSMMTTWIWSGTLGAFCDMLVLRLDEHTQYETRVVAQQVAEIVKELFPVSYKALVEK